MANLVSGTLSEHDSKIDPVHVKVRDQLEWINNALLRSSGSERRALEKARDELLNLMLALTKVSNSNQLT